MFCLGLIGEQDDVGKIVGLFKVEIRARKEAFERWSMLDIYGLPLITGKILSWIFFIKSRARKFLALALGA